MKKFLLSLLLAGFALGAKAQTAADNTLFMSLNAGIAYYQHSGDGQLGVPAAGFSIGRWLMRPLAFRISADIAMAPSAAIPAGSTNSALFLMGSAEFMWDVNATFFHVYNKNFLYPCPIYPLIGLGLLYRPEFELYGEKYQADHDFQAMLGFNLPVRLGSGWDAFLQYKCFFLPQTFDNSVGDNYMHSITVGLTHRWSDDPFHRRTPFETRSNNDDWFIAFGIGVNVSSFGFENIFDLSSRLINFCPDFFVGRNYSKVWTIRVGLSGYFGRERAHFETVVVNDGASTQQEMRPGKWYTFNMLNTDFMINLTHLFNFNRGVKWNFLPYLGAGPVWRYETHPRINFAADAGIMARRYINATGDFYIDLKYIMVPPRVAGGAGPSGSIFSAGYPTLTFGYIHNFGRSTTRYRMPVNSTIN